jgi:hypothetical protein
MKENTNKKNLNQTILGWTFAVHLPLWTPLLSLVALPGSFLYNGTEQDESKQNDWLEQI